MAVFPGSASQGMANCALGGTRFAGITIAISLPSRSFSMILLKKGKTFGYSTNHYLTKLGIALHTLFSAATVTALPNVVGRSSALPWMSPSIRQHSAFRRLASCTVPGNFPGFPRSVQPTLTPQGALQLIPKESEQVQFVITTSLRPIPPLSLLGGAELRRGEDWALAGRGWGGGGGVGEGRGGIGGRGGEGVRTQGFTAHADAAHLQLWSLISLECYVLSSKDTCSAHF